MAMGFLLTAFSLYTNVAFQYQWWLDNKRFSLKTRGRYAFKFIVVTQTAWWIWATVLATRFRVTKPIYDWSDSGFGPAFALYIVLTFGFQINYLFL